MSKIISYHGCPEFERLRTVYDTDSGELYFSMEDLCVIFGYEMRELRAKVDNSDVATLHEVIVITKKGLYDFLHSNKTDKALRFENWLTLYVLPSIYKEFELPNSPLPSMKEMAKLLRHHTNLEVAQILLYEESMYFRDILQSPRLVQTRHIAEDYGISRRKFNRMLRKVGIIYWEDGEWFLCPEYEDCNLTDVEVASIEGPDGISVDVEQYGWTQYGRLFIYDKLARIGIYPLFKEQREMKKKNK